MTLESLGYTTTLMGVPPKVQPNNVIDTLKTSLFDSTILVVFCYYLNLTLDIEIRACFHEHETKGLFI